MAVNSCEPCEGCNPQQLARTVDTYRAAVLTILCGILGAETAAVNDNMTEVLWDREDGVDTPFLRRYTVDALGTVTATDTELDGTTAYVVGGTAVAPNTPSVVSSARNLSGGVTGVVIKAAPGKLLDVEAFNINTTAIAYLKLYDQTTNPTSGDTPIRTLPIPAQAGGAGFVFPTNGIEFTTGIAYRVSLAPADNDNTAPAADEIILNFGYA